MRHRTPLPILRLGLLLGLLSSAPAAAQTTWHVPGDAATIQDGLDLAQSGDTVLVGPGVYEPNGLDFDGKAIRLKSSDGPEATILDGRNLYRLIRFHDGEGPDTVVEGFTLRNGQGPDSSFSYPVHNWGGGAIEIDGYASPTIRRCVFFSNRGGAGAFLGNGVHGFDAFDKGEDGGHGTDGKDALRGGHGGAIWVFGGQPLIEGCVFWNNVAGDGGKGGYGGDGGDGGDWGFLKSPGDGGDGGDGGEGGDGGRGGAIATQVGSITVVNCLFLDNRSGYGGSGGQGGTGGKGGDGTFANPDGGDEGSNGAGGRGGDAGDGGALACIDTGYFQVVGCTFVNNTLGFPGFGSGSAVDGQTGTGVVLQAASGAGAIESSILWNNGPGLQVWSNIIKKPPVVYSNLQQMVSGAGNISVDPLFTAASPKWKGYALKPGSPCIDMGGVVQTLPVPATALVHDLTGHQRSIDDPQSPNLGLAGQVIDMGAREYVPAAQVEPLTGCGTNPPGSLTLLAGAATLGGALTFGIDNPLGTQAPGSLGVLTLSVGTQPLAPCGQLVPGFGMAGGGAAGELFLDYSPGKLVWTKLAGAWSGSGQPVTIDVPVTTKAVFLGLPIFVQGAIVDPSFGAAAPIGVTEGLRLVHGL